MKVIILSNSHNSEIFESKDSLIDFLNNQKIKGVDISEYKVVFGDFKVEYEQDGLMTLNSNVNKIQRDLKIKSLTEDSESSIQEFISLLTELAPESKDKKIILAKLSVISDKKELSKLISSNSNYLLYQVSNSVEWFKLLLSIYNFRKINDSFVKEYVRKDGTSEFCNCVTPQDIIDSFNEAKKLIKKR